MTQTSQGNMIQVAERAGIILPRPIPAQLTCLAAAANSEEFTCYFEGEDGNEETEMEAKTNLLVAADEPDVSQTVFSIINDSGMFYTGVTISDTAGIKLNPEKLTFILQIESSLSKHASESVGRFHHWSITDADQCFLFQNKINCFWDTLIQKKYFFR